MSRRLLAASAAIGLLAIGRSAAAYCPSYSPDSAQNTHNCGVASQDGKNPTKAEWQPIFDLVSQGPTVWGSQGPAVGDIGQGCGHPQALHNVPARFPCELLKGIAMQESGWRQFCVPDTPSDEVGGASRTLISFDCGYGIGQVTSGMHAGETPNFDRDRVAGDPTYNLATGTLILAAKWKATNCVGDNQPAIIEDWYIAAWAYNGLAYVNNPNNPNYDPNRGVWDPAIGGGAPYQEKVFGWIEHTGGQWTPTQLAYPNPGDLGSSGSPPDIPEPDCASPTDCTNHRQVHQTVCNGTAGAGGSGGGGGGAGGAGQGSGGANTGAGGAAPGSGGGETTGGAGSGSGGSAALHVKGGCGCRAAGETGDGGGAVWAFGAMVAAIAARRRRRS
jgi:MYXO-CTERM domain-containing protein